LYSGNVVPQQDQFNEVLDGLWPESAAADTTTVITSPTIPDYMLPSIDSDFAENKGTNSYSLSSLSGLSVEQFQTIAATYNVSETKLTLAIEIMKGNSGYTLQGDLVLLLNKPVGELITLYQNLE
jgi:hypothetical protein